MIHGLRRYVYIVCFLLLFALGGCSSVMRHEPSWLTVETNPVNITVTLIETASGISTNYTAPFKIVLNKRSDYILRVESPHYCSDDVRINRRLSYWFWGNVMTGWGALVGMSVDLITGNMWIHNPQLVSLNLSSLEDAPETLKLNIPVSLVDDHGRETVDYVPLIFRKKI